MRNLLYALSIGLTAATTYALPVVAQEKESGKLGEYDEIIIKRKSGEDKDAKVTIEIKGGEVLVDGKKLEDYKNGDVTVRRRAIRPRNGNTGMGFDRGFQMDEGNSPREFAIGGNRAVLGVMTEKKEAAGATITEVREGSPAAKAGLKTGDVILKVNDKKVAEPQDLYEAIGGMNPGDKVTVTYKRNNKESKATATLTKNTDTAPRAFSLPGTGGGNNYSFRIPRDRMPFEEFFQGGGPRLGLSVQDTEEGNGARVQEVTPGSAADKAGFKENDLITEIAGKTVKNARDVAQSYKDSKDQGTITAKVNRNGNVQTLSIKVPKRLNTENL